MKRKKEVYSNVAYNTIYECYTLLFWNRCWLCEEEFRREHGYRFQLQYNGGWLYSCASCSASKSDCNTKVGEQFKAMRSVINVSRH